MKAPCVAVAAVVLLGFMAHLPAASAQPVPRPKPAPAPLPGREVAQMFDAYALMHAQEEIGLRDDQYAEFVRRFKALQDTRRRVQQERLQRVEELRRLTQRGPADDAQLKERLKALEALDARAVTETREALDAVDQTLDVRQRVKFRLFEDQVERRKLELLMRVRRANRPPRDQGR